MAKLFVWKRELISLSQWPGTWIKPFILLCSNKHSIAFPLQQISM